MGSKGGDTTVDTPTVENNAQEESASAYMATMQQMNAMMLQQMARMQEQQLLSSIPEVTEAPEVDWSEAQAELAAKAKATYGLDQAQKVGRSATIVSSPLLDDEEAVTTQSVLAGSK